MQCYGVFYYYKKEKRTSFYIHLFHKIFFKFPPDLPSKHLIHASFMLKNNGILFQKLFWPSVRKIIRWLKSGQNKKGQNIFCLRRFLNPFSQLPAVKKDSKMVQLDLTFFGPSYFVTAFVQFIRTVTGQNDFWNRMFF